MMHSIFFLIATFAAAQAAFDWTMGNLTLWHSEATYCDPASYLTRTPKGILAGFKATYKIYDKVHDTNGYIGYTTSQSTIYVAFRGSESIANWISNLDAVLTSYPLCLNCNVHAGFYAAEKNVISGILAEVKRLKGLYPTYKIVVTGHSLGAALATLTVMDIDAAGLGPVQLFNYGSPRVFDGVGSAYVSGKLSVHSRVTHHKDIVVHCPTSVRMVHINAEWYEPDNTVPVYLNACTGYEDPKCSYQWSVTSIDDHLWYLNVVMGTGGCSAVL